MHQFFIAEKTHEAPHHHAFLITGLPICGSKAEADHWARIATSCSVVLLTWRALKWKSWGVPACSGLSRAASISSNTSSLILLFHTT